MIAVIFTAKIKQLDDEYSRMAEQLRKVAMSEYGCLEFTSISQGRDEIAISYWQDEDQVRRWKNAARHRVAQDLGQKTWYESYRVDVLSLIRRYGQGTDDEK